MLDHLNTALAALGALLLTAAVGCLAVACLLYVLVDRPGLRDPLADLATIITPLVGAAGLFRGASRASQ
ncbi:hypothetical protein LUR56_39700 [Streptomyces sp. MT29]|nr:hypothetical protein [Streptomyces sp. MT29]